MKRLTSTKQIRSRIPNVVVQWYDNTAQGIAHQRSWLFRVAVDSFMGHIKNGGIMEPLPNMKKQEMTKVSFYPGPVLKEAVRKLAKQITFTEWRLWKYILVWYWHREKL